MTQGTNLKAYDNSVDEIDMFSLFIKLWQNKLFLVSFSVLFATIAAVYSLSLPDIYQSKALLSPVEQTSTPQSSSTFGGIASLAGLTLTQEGSSKELKAIEKMKSLSFYSENIMPNIYLPDLMAFESWDSANNTLHYDDELFDGESKKWVRKVKKPKTQIPSAQESFKAFKKIFNISVNDDSGFVTISVSHQSPFIAKEWTELVVDQINEYFRSYDKLETQASMDYLKNEIANTSYTEIRQVIAALIEQKMQRMTLIEASEFYIFSYLDPPKVMEERDQPRRTRLTLLGFIIGLLLSIIIILARDFFNRSAKS